MKMYASRYDKQRRTPNDAPLKIIACMRLCKLTARTSLARAASRTASITSSSVLFRERFLRVESESVAVEEKALHINIIIMSLVLYSIFNFVYVLRTDLYGYLAGTRSSRRVMSSVAFSRLRRCFAMVLTNQVISLVEM